MNNTLLLMGMICPIASFSQNAEDLQIRQWQSSNPTVVCISAQNFNALSGNQKKLLGNTIVFNEKITIEQLNAYNQQFTDKAAQYQESSIGDAERNYVKNWLGSHQDLQIVKHSKYILLDPTRQTWCNDPVNRILVLSGEEVTRADIDNSKF